MHDRMIRDRFWRDEELGALGPEGALLFQGLWALADDYGCLEDRPAIIHAEVFMVFEMVTRERCRVLLEALVDLNKVRRYTAGGKQYLSIPNFLRYQELAYLRTAEHPLPDWVRDEIKGLYPDGKRLRKRPDTADAGPDSAEDSEPVQTILEKSENIQKGLDHSPSRVRAEQNRKEQKGNEDKPPAVVVRSDYVSTYRLTIGRNPPEDEWSALRAIDRLRPEVGTAELGDALEKARDREAQSPAGYAKGVITRTRAEHGPPGPVVAPYPLKTAEDLYGPLPPWKQANP